MLERGPESLVPAAAAAAIATSVVVAVSVVGVVRLLLVVDTTCSAYTSAVACIGPIVVW